MIRYLSTGFIIIKKNKKWITNPSKNFGKWIIYSQNPSFLSQFKRKLDALVEKEEIKQVKFINIKKLSNFGKNFLPQRKKSFLCIYCYKKDKERVKSLLKKIGLEPKEWKSNLQTILDWLPGGNLYEEMKRSYSPEEFKDKKKSIINLKYWNFIKRILRKELSENKFHKIKQEVFKALYL